ncbi:nuclear transport factor 2 family protein [Pseudonocardia sp. HH130630-07]|uniref:nuclear transport factor 2 family protein n=1 Tax=Pseudonocardia sp. HH130630-07 TaxID=1690815 RepID=UPI00081528E1|nr:nuclear transport factor 2 family protein [Pseudonocardia sp. HH130630-07]ANY10844.1 hypothetical protein AFB00_31120 [Pseudonocardia sp. HH130630-07]
MTVSHAGTVHELVERWRAAEESNDGEWLEELLDPDFVGVGPFGWTRTREEWTGRYRSGRVVNDEIHLDDVHVRAWDDAAVVVAVQHQRGRNGTADTTGRFRVTLTARRDGSAWRVAGLHIGPLRDA